MRHSSARRGCYMRATPSSSELAIGWNAWCGGYKTVHQGGRRWRPSAEGGRRHQRLRRPLRAAIEELSHCPASEKHGPGRRVSPNARRRGGRQARAGNSGSTIIHPSRHRPQILVALVGGPARKTTPCKLGFGYPSWAKDDLGSVASAIMGYQAQRKRRAADVATWARTMGTRCAGGTADARHQGASQCSSSTAQQGPCNVCEALVPGIRLN